MDAMTSARPLVCVWGMKQWLEESQCEDAAQVDNMYVLAFYRH